MMPWSVARPWDAPEAPPLVLLAIPCWCVAAYRRDAAGHWTWDAESTVPCPSCRDRPCWDW